MTLEEKKRKVQKRGACFTCLKTGHISKKCKMNVKCPVCGKKHVVLLCPDISTSNSPFLSQQKSDTVSTVQTSLNCTCEVILRTMMVRVMNPATRKMKTLRVLLDCGSQRSYLLGKTAEKLGLVPVRTLTINHSLFGGSEVTNQYHNVFDVDVLSLQGSKIFKLRVLDQNRICGGVPRVLKGSWMMELQKRKIFVSDLDSQNSTEVEMLIGADYMGDLLTGRIIRLGNGLTATETVLGWTLMGQTQHSPSSKTLAMLLIGMSVTSASVADLWKLDVLGINDPAEVQTREEREQLAQRHFLDTVTRMPDGRYSVSLPWISGVTDIPNNQAVAEKRLESTIKKLNSLGKFLEYDQVFKLWESEEMISKVDSVLGAGHRCHYLPHRAVLKPQSKSTPLRPVFDASCKQGRAPSLNDCLEKGPNLLELIPSILMRFRMGKIGATADIRKAFLMVAVNEPDREFLKFLWLEDPQQMTFVTYRHNRVVFGMNCSPFLLGAVLNHHLNGVKNVDEHVVKKIRISLYVDNLVVSANSREEYEHLKTVATKLMSQAKMDLRRWECSGIAGDDAVTTVLGLKWDKVKDTLYCVTLPSEISFKVTKRVILSKLQCLFDPLGFLSPVLLIPKLILQEAWTEDRKWDEELGEEAKCEFLRWMTELNSLLEVFRIPRDSTRGAGTERERFQLHVFADASKRAYAAVVFLRVETRQGVTVQLVLAKARVAPVKSITIPRLELLGCTIATRLANSVKKALNLEEVPVRYWSDSSTALCWIKRNDAWGTFVGNRVREILKSTKSEEWYYIPGDLNPADLPSRGIQPEQFLDSRWWEGPTWLYKEKSDWPKSIYRMDEEAIGIEMKKTIVSLVVQSKSNPWYLVRNSYHVNLRILAFVFRFLDKVRQRSSEKSFIPTVHEVNQAEVRLLKLVQKDSFSNGDVSHGLKLLKDKDGLFRVKTKLTNRQDLLNFREPILLPNFNPVVDLLIRDQHLFNSHGGIQVMMGVLREKFWVIGGRRAVKRVVKSCVTCQRFTAKNTGVPSSALPEDRVSDVGAFEVTGIDLAGPLVLRDKTKAWIILFTCGVYRAIHLEVVQSLSTEDFLLAFVRFCKRKRRPKTIYTDNGSNFVGANNLFRRINWREVETRTQQQRINWRFIPPSAPWWGGWWERLIRSVKDLLKRMLGFGKVNLVTLETCLCEVESVVNHRPLTFVTEDQEDLIPLTPAQFIHDLPECEIPESKLLKMPTLGNKKRSLDQLFRELQNRFRKEYLGLLVQRGKETKTHTFQKGDFVFVGQDYQKRIFWPMARITTLIPGKDGVCRIARVRTKNGELLRPLNRLYPLEVSQKENLVQQREKLEKVDPQRLSLPEVKTRSGRLVRRPLPFDHQYC